MELPGFVENTMNPQNKFLETEHEVYYSNALFHMDGSVRFPHDPINAHSKLP